MQHLRDKPGWRVRLKHKQNSGNDIGHGKGVGMLVITERPGFVAVEIKGTNGVPPIRTGNPKIPRAPAWTTRGVKAGHRGIEGATRSGSATTMPERWASMHGPSPKVY